MSARRKKATNVVSLADYRKRHAAEDRAPAEEDIIDMLRELTVIWGKIAKLRGERQAEVCQLAGAAMRDGLMAHKITEETA